MVWQHSLPSLKYEKRGESYGAGSAAVSGVGQKAKGGAYTLVIRGTVDFRFRDDRSLHFSLQQSY